MSNDEDLASLIRELNALYIHKNCQERRIQEILEDNQGRRNDREENEERSPEGGEFVRVPVENLAARAVEHHR